jgi:hypothetical protein
MAQVNPEQLARLKRQLNNTVARKKQIIPSREGQIRSSGAERGKRDRSLSAA